MLSSSVAGLSRQQTPLTIRPENRRFQLPLDAPENTAVTRGELLLKRTNSDSVCPKNEER